MILNITSSRALLVAAFLVPLLISVSAEAHPDPAHSLAELDRHLAETPDDPMLHLRRAELLLRRDHPAEARPSVERALSLAPDHPEVVLLGVRSAHAEKDLPRALSRAREAAERFPDFAANWKWLALIQKESGQTDEAITSKLRHLSFKDVVHPADFLTVVTWLQERNGKGDALKALEAVDQAVELFGPIVALQQAAIPLEISLARHEQALARVAALVKKYGPSASSSLLRADVFEAAGRYAEAGAACDSALAMLATGKNDNKDPLAAVREKIEARKQENLRRIK